MSLGIGPILRDLERDALARRMRATFSTAAGTAFYPFSTTAGLSALGTVYWIQSVMLVASRYILTWKEGRETANLLDASTPEFWDTAHDATGLFGLELRPPPSGILSIEVSAYCSPHIATLIGPSTDELNLEADVEDALCYGAAAVMCDADSEYQRAGRWQARYIVALERLRAKLNMDRGDLPSIQDGSTLDQYFE